MSQPRLILHVGGAKCGSSAFQTALSLQSRLTAQGTPGLTYAALHATRGLIHGNELLRVAQSNGFGYASSSVAPDLRDMDRAQRNAALADLRDLLAKNDTVILSNEGWLPRVNMMSKCGLLDDLGVPFEVFAVVRPQVEFINSGWWQWGAWTKAPSLERWAIQARKAAPQYLWHSHLRKWARHSACTNVTVRLMSRDIVGDFFDAFGLTSDPDLPMGRVSNASLPGEVLRLFQRHPSLRTGRAVIDFVLGQFDLGTQPTPWVMDQELTKEIVALSREDNEALCAMLPQEQAKRMRDTPSWWSADAWTEKSLETSQPLPPDPIVSQRMNEQLIAALRDVAERLLIGPQLSKGLLTPSSADVSIDQLDAHNADLAETLFTSATALRTQEASPEANG